MTSLRRFSDGCSCRLLVACALLAVFSLASTPHSVRAQAVDTGGGEPSELFLKAYASVQQGEKLEADGQLRLALAKYRFAASVLEQISQNNPNWQALIVKYRQRKTAESIQRLEQRIYLQPPAEDPAAAGQPALVNGAAPSADDDLPQADDPLPGVGNAPVNVATPMQRRNRGEMLVAADSDEIASRAAIDRATQDLRARLEKSEKSLKTALNQLSTAKKDKEQAQREKREIESQMASSRTDAQLAIKRAERAKADRDEAQKDYDRIQARLKDALVKNPTATETRKELRDQLAETKKSLDKANAEAKAANKEKDELTAKVSQAEGSNVDLIKQRDDATAKVELTRDAAAKIEALQTENANLTQKLTAAEAQIATLNADATKKKDEVEGMQKELVSLKDELVRSRDLNDRSATTITELHAQLDASATELKDFQVKGAASEEITRMTKENELLRGIVMRQMKDQARRSNIKKLLTDELARLEVQSKTLTDQVELLGQPTQALTDEERALFKDPQVALSDNSNSNAAGSAPDSDPTSMAFSIVAVKPKGSNTPAESPAPTAESSPAAAPTSPEASPASAAAASPTPAAGDATAAASAAAPGGGGPKVETTFNPKVADALKPKATEANDAFSRGKYVEAENLYEQLLAKEPKNTYLLYNQGVVLFRQDKLKRAEVLLRKAAKAAPTDAATQSTLGIIYYRMHHYDEAIDCLTMAIRLDPKNATAHNYLGITSSQKGWPEAAADELSKAIALNPNYADAHFNLAVIYATNTPPSKDRAKEHYQIAIELGATPDPKLEKLIKN